MATPAPPAPTLLARVITDFWDDLTRYDIESHPAFKLAAKWKEAVEVAAHATPAARPVLVRRALAALRGNASPTWIHLLALAAGTADEFWNLLPQVRTHDDSDDLLELARLLMCRTAADTETIIRKAGKVGEVRLTPFNLGVVHERWRELTAQLLRASIVEEEVLFLRPKQELLFHLLARGARLYSTDEPERRALAGSLLCPLLWMLFGSHRDARAFLMQFVGATTLPSSPHGHAEYERVVSLYAETDHLAEIEHVALHRHAAILQEFREALSGKGKGRVDLNRLLHKPRERGQLTAGNKGTKLGQVTFLLYKPVTDAKHGRSDTIPLFERLKDIAQMQWWTLNASNDWEPQEETDVTAFKMLVDAAFASGWDRRMLQRVFTPQNGRLLPHDAAEVAAPPAAADGRVLPQVVWASDGEFTLFLILACVAKLLEGPDGDLEVDAWLDGTRREGLVFTSEDVLPDGGPRTVPPPAWQVDVGATFDQLITGQHLFIDGKPGRRFWALFNFLERHTRGRIHPFAPCSQGNACKVQDVLNAAVTNIYGALLQSRDGKLDDVLRNGIRTLVPFLRATFSLSIKHLKEHARLPSILLELALRHRSPAAPRSLFLFPLFHARHGDERHVVPFAILGGTMLSLEGDLWPHVTARHNAHLWATYQLLQPGLLELVADQLSFDEAQIRIDARKGGITDKMVGHLVSSMTRGFNRVNELKEARRRKLAEQAGDGVARVDQDLEVAIKMHEALLMNVWTVLAELRPKVHDEPHVRPTMGAQTPDEMLQDMAEQALRDDLLNRNLLSGALSTFRETLAGIPEPYTDRSDYIDAVTAFAETDVSGTPEKIAAGDILAGHVWTLHQLPDRRSVEGRLAPLESVLVDFTRAFYRVAQKTLLEIDHGTSEQDRARAIEFQEAWPNALNLMRTSRLGEFLERRLPRGRPSTDEDVREWSARKSELRFDWEDIWKDLSEIFKPKESGHRFSLRGQTSVDGIWFEYEGDGQKYPSSLLRAALPLWDKPVDGEDTHISVLKALLMDRAASMRSRGECTDVAVCIQALSDPLEYVITVLQNNGKPFKPGLVRVADFPGETGKLWEAATGWVQIRFRNAADATPLVLAGVAPRRRLPLDQATHFVCGVEFRVSGYSRFENWS